MHIFYNIDGNSTVERMSPYNSNYSQMYYGANNALHTPESSPTHSPDATLAVSNPRNRKLNGNTTTNISRGKNQDDVTVTSSLPTPEMSPLELEKENYNNSLSNDKQKQISFIDYNGHIKSEKVHHTSGGMTLTSYVYSNTANSNNRNLNTYDMDSIENHIIKREYNFPNANNSSNVNENNKTQSNNARSSYHNSIYDSSGISLPSNTSGEKRNYTSTATSTLSASLSSSTTIAAGKGMYVTCSSRGILDQGNIVRGTYFPPLATTQDHQNLGTVTPSQTVSASSMSNLNYTSNHHLDGNALHMNQARILASNSTSNTNSSLMPKENNSVIIGGDASSIVSSQNGLTIDGYGSYETINVTAPMPTYATTSPFNPQYKEYVNYHQTQSPISNSSVSQSIHSQQHMVDEVDSREFEKYFKYPDSNHNFNEYDSNSAYHGHSIPPQNSIYHNHQLASNAIPHVLSSPHHPATIAPQEYYHLYYHPTTTAVTSGKSINV